MNRNVRMYSVLFFCLRFSVCFCVYVAMTAAVADDAESGVPFVSGFDRFGRHGDIDAVTAGRLLITELSCSACHRADDATLSPKRGPVLDGAGSRLQPDWIRSFLLSPTITKHGTTMPDMLAALPEENRTSIADAITAFLVSLNSTLSRNQGHGAQPRADGILESWRCSRMADASIIRLAASHVTNPTRNTKLTAVKRIPTGRSAGATGRR
jgi:hypothetical protein